MTKEAIRKSLGKAFLKLNRDMKELNLSKEEIIVINKYTLSIIDELFKEFHIDINKELSKHEW